jgi:hypothetical protein
VVLTKAAVRKLLTAALVVTALRFLLNIFPTWIDVANETTAFAALVDEPTDTWRQPESSPDPRLLAD